MREPGCVSLIGAFAFLFLSAQCLSIVVASLSLPSFEGGVGIAYGLGFTLGVIAVLLVWRSGREALTEFDDD